MSYERSIVDDCYCIIDRLWGQTIEPSLCTRYRCGTVHVRHSPLPNVAGTLTTERVRARPSVEAIPNTTRRDSAIRRRHESEQAGVVHSGSTGCYTLRKVETSEVGRLESIPREDTYPSKPMFFILLGQPKTWGIPTHPGRFSPVDDPHDELPGLPNTSTHSKTSGAFIGRWTGRGRDAAPEDVRQRVLGDRRRNASVSRD